MLDIDPDMVFVRRCRARSVVGGGLPQGETDTGREEGPAGDGVAAFRSKPSRFSFGVGVGGGRMLAPMPSGPPGPSETDIFRRSAGVAHAGSTLMTDRMGKMRSEGSFWRVPWPSW